MKPEEIIKEGLGTLYEDEVFINDIYLSRKDEYNAIFNAIVTKLSQTDGELLLTPKEISHIEAEALRDSNQGEHLLSNVYNAIAKAQLSKVTAHYTAQLEAKDREIELLRDSYARFVEKSALLAKSNKTRCDSSTKQAVNEAKREDLERIEQLLDISPDESGSYIRISNHVPYSSWESLKGE